MMTDPIADMLTRIRNASRVRHEAVEFLYSKMRGAIAEILEKEGYVARVARDEPRRMIRIILKYEGGTPAISEIVRVSKPGQRVYARADALPRVRGGFGIAILSTPKGMMTNKDARAARVGGEVVCTIF